MRWVSQKYSWKKKFTEKFLVDWNVEVMEINNKLENVWIREYLTRISGDYNVI